MPIEHRKVRKVLDDRGLPQIIHEASAELDLSTEVASHLPQSDDGFGKKRHLKAQINVFPSIIDAFILKSEKK